ncbi:MAG: hypothetical protein KDJ14_15765, partial [Xanthomonadales bacterium]|nr:hypothetical protein [Xanthomonadales bacterium]
MLVVQRVFRAKRTNLHEKYDYPESAGISRNALYRYHRDVLLALHDAQSRHRDRPEAAKRVAAQL